jgi:DNA-binding NarL/FixJ family response regulator
VEARTGFAPDTETVSAERDHTQNAVVVAGDGGTRALLQGLLRMNLVPVVGEAAGENEGFELVRRHRPTILVVDVGLADGSWNGLVGQARALVSQLRVIVIAPASNPPSPSGDPSQRADITLVRPFLLRDFAEALLPAKAG